MISPRPASGTQPRTRLATPSTMPSDIHRLDDLPALGPPLHGLSCPSTHVRLMPNAVQVALTSTLVLLGGAMRATRTQRDRSAPDTLGAVTMLMFPGRTVRTPRPVGAGSTPAAGAFVTQVLVLFGGAMRAARSVGDRTAIEAFFHLRLLKENLRRNHEPKLPHHLGATRTRRPDGALAARYTRWVAGR